VNHSIRGGCCLAQAFEVFEVASMDLGTGGGERFCARIAASQSEDLMARVDEFPDKGRTDEACGSGYENTQDDFSFTSLHDQISWPHSISGPHAQAGYP
jgi:hypothetical protein